MFASFSYDIDDHHASFLYDIDDHHYNNNLQSTFYNVWKACTKLIYKMSELEH